METTTDRFENFKHHRAVFVFEYPDTRDWIGIAICDHEIMPIGDPEVVRFILNYRGNLKCDVRVEMRDWDGTIRKLHGFEWSQIRRENVNNTNVDNALANDPIHDTTRYRFYYDCVNRILAADGHLWQITTRDRGSVINSLYALAAKRRIPITNAAVRLAYKSLKLVDRVAGCESALVDKVSNIVYRINKVEDVPTILPDQFCIIKPYKDAFMCARNGCSFAAYSLRGESYTIPDYLISRFISRCIECI